MADQLINPFSPEGRLLTWMMVEMPKAWVVIEYKDALDFIRARAAEIQAIHYFNPETGEGQGVVGPPSNPDEIMMIPQEILDGMQSDDLILYHEREPSDITRANKHVAGRELLEFHGISPLKKITLWVVMRE